MNNQNTKNQLADLSDAFHSVKTRRRELLVQIALHGETIQSETEVSPQELLILRDYIKDCFGDGSHFSNRDLARGGPNQTRKKTAVILGVLMDAGIINRAPSPHIKYCLAMI
jgi:hypothetical protein